MGSQSIMLTDPKKGDYFYEEAIKTLRTNLLFSGKDKKVILITSAYSGEGKSDISLHLAEEMGKTGKKVLLLDTDLRKSVYVSRYQVGKKVNGLSQLLSGQIEGMEEIIYQTNYDNVHMIFAGPYAPNPAELLGSEAFDAMLKEARQRYDYVLIDTPPLDVVVDAAVVGQYCDGALLVIESEAVSYRVSQKVKNQLEKSGCKVLGAVLTKVDVRNSTYYGKKYKKYEYGQYGNKEASNV